jgi:hypothetical protein
MTAPVLQSLAVKAALGVPVRSGQPLLVVRR